ncbi:MAG: aminoacyl-tRNA hydrolase [Candidatus Limivicinus sp.]
MLFSSRPVSWLVVFLGNPGLRYEGTRHNAGFMAADAFARKHNVRISRARFRSLTAQCGIGDQQVLLMKPQTFMNLSGEAVGQAARFYKIPPEHILVLSDDITLPVGSLRIRTKGSAGGHNGLKNIIEVLGTDAFPRIRIGVGIPPHPDYETIDWVLSVFRDQDAADMAEAAERAADAAECYIAEGAEKAMNRYSQKKVRGCANDSSR